MHLLQAVSVLGIFSGIAWAGPWAITQSPTEQPFWTANRLAMKVDGPLFRGFDERQGNDPGMINLYEAVDWNSYNHFYTTSQADKDAVIPPSTTGTTVCGVIGTRCSKWVNGSEKERVWVWPTDGPGRVPLHRFLSPDFLFFYTLGFEEGVAAGFTYDKVAAWVLPHTSEVAGTKVFYRWSKA